MVSVAAWSGTWPNLPDGSQKMRCKAGGDAGEAKKSKNQNLHFVPVLFLFVTGGVSWKFCEAGAVVRRCFCWFSVCMERRGVFIAVSMRSNLQYPK